ncbi:MAG: hypothetical protein V3W45_06350 [Sedimentisphaerales bacterium]
MALIESGVDYTHPDLAANIWINPGNLLKVELSIPPTAGLLEFGGRISGLGKVLRIRGISDSHTVADLPADRYGVAVEFSLPLKLRT